MAISSEDEMRLLHDESSGKRSDHESYSERARTLSSESVGEDTISKNINGRRCISQIPGIKEPQYIVIRIPACDKCAEQKMILLDGATKDCETQTCINLLKNDRIATATNDGERRS
ncbi:unnamed protein product [Brugia pahangi]|uniref:Uncharacterized protein n=1 Tax=Brugia pahangi TaxID=6280 RepID=A0A0N4TZP9_BRUPA|nr:unnamed protein product [Brugia pahangi]